MRFHLGLPAHLFAAGAVVVMLAGSTLGCGSASAPAASAPSASVTAASVPVAGASSKALAAAPSVAAPRAADPAPVIGMAPGDERDDSAAQLLKSEPEPLALEQSDGNFRVLSGGVGIEDIIVGSGLEVATGQRLVVHYVGRLVDGDVFDSSRKRGRPFTYEFGAGQVISGWEDGVAGMRVGGVRRVVIPPHKGYGSRKMAHIPADSILEFEIEVIAIQ